MRNQTQPPTVNSSLGASAVIKHRGLGLVPSRCVEIV